MAEITRISVVGDWRVVVQSRDAGWAQRVLCRSTAAGDVTLVGTVGASVDVYGQGIAPWELIIEHDDGTHGWQESWLRPGPRVVAGPGITQVVESEDTTTADSDRDFNDLVVRLEKLGMVDQPTRPFAVWPTSLQMTPEGIFETSLGRYFMGVRVRNVWTEPWPAGAHVGITDRCRAWLQAGGIDVVDAWSAEDQAALGQTVAGGRVRVGPLAPWDSRLVYFKVDVSRAVVRKHNVEVAVLSPVAEELDHLNRGAIQKIFVSRTTFDPVKKVFVSRSDRGTLTAAVRELVVDYNTFKRAVGRARELFPSGGAGGAGMVPVTPMRGPRCGAGDLERLRERLRRFLAGEEDDICAIWRELQCCCAYQGYRPPGRDGDGDDWTGRGGTGLEFLAFPAVVDYRIDYHPDFAGQHGPLPFDDPWWKLLLMLIALLLGLGAAASAAADLANRSEDVVIGQVARSVLLDAGGTVDAAVVLLNGRRSLSAALFSYLDAATGEVNTAPVVALDGLIDTAGTNLTNTQIAAAIAAFAANPADAAAQAGVRVFKSGARTGLTFGRMTAVEPLTRDDDGTTRTFVNQVRIEEDPTLPNGVSNSGDSGSLWLHLASRSVVALNHAGSRDTNTAWGSRIEDVMTQMGIRFA
ncbi:MAG: hypothetical protein M5U22_09870 [Thermoleophilia bacterium]|nr:hypothetical protein [Thermoleophilia bacterium]